jgi:hypothetical protein
MESNILAALDFRHKPSGRTEGPAAGRLAACGRGWQLAALLAWRPTATCKGPPSAVCERPEGGATRRRTVGMEGSVLTRPHTPLPC